MIAADFGGDMGTSVLFIYFHDVSDISTLRPVKHASMHPEPCIMSCVRGIERRHIFSKKQGAA